ncbi:hypothetical protein D3C84_1136340 [compost metagenome]
MVNNLITVNAMTNMGEAHSRRNAAAAESRWKVQTDASIIPNYSSELVEGTCLQGISSLHPANHFVVNFLSEREVSSRFGM